MLRHSAIAGAEVFRLAELTSPTLLTTAYMDCTLYIRVRFASISKGHRPKPQPGL